MSRRLNMHEGGRSFGREVAENVSSRLGKIFETGKIEEKSRVVIDFDDPDDAKEFKEEMKKRFK